MKSGLEWRNSFNIQYNNLFNGLAPGLNDYEISYYLTKAQKEIVNEYYTGFYSKRESAEQTEKVRRILAPIVKAKIVGAPGGQYSYFLRINGIEEGDIKSYSLDLGDDVYRILEESAKIIVEGEMKFVMVKPERHDYYWKIKNNPFRTVGKKRVWRIEVNDMNDGSVELLSKYPIREYRCRYLTYPKPIIISDLWEGDFEGLELTIDGYHKPMDSPFDNTVNDIIINRAVELATRDYKENNLSNQVLLNDRAQ